MKRLQNVVARAETWKQKRYQNVSVNEDTQKIDGTKLLSRKKTAAYLGLQAQTLASWAVTGKYGLPFVKVGRSVRYRLSDLETWVSSRTVGVLADSKGAGNDN